MGVQRGSAAVAAVLVLALAGCGGSTPAVETGGGTAANPVTIEFWGWGTGQQQQADVFNASHDTVKLKYVKYAGNPATKTALNNAVQSGQNVPCLVQATGPAITMQADGLATPIGKYLAKDRAKFSPAAYDAVTLDGESFGVPFAANPSFLMYNKAVYAANGLTIPKTWDDVIAQGVALKGKGIDVMNLAGEDPSFMLGLVAESGGSWFSVSGDTWKVAIDTSESRRAVAVLQQMVDLDIVSHETFADIPAMAQYYDQGKMINLPLSTWQLTAWQTRLKTSHGSWAVAPLPAIAGSGVTTTPGGFNSFIVPKGCTNPAAATIAAVALATDPTQIALSSSPTDGTGSFPVVPDPTSYIQNMLPTKLLGENLAGASDIVKQAAASTAVVGRDSPSTAVTSRIAEVWAQAMTKKITFNQLLTTLQTDATTILKSQGINVS